MAQWSDLPLDLVVSIAKRVLLLEHFIVFGAVCRSWKSAATKENFTRTHQVPLLMLPEKKGTTLREFCSLKHGKVFKQNMPELVTGKLFYSSLGWLMTHPSWTSDYTVMIHSCKRLAFCRPGLGDQQWNVIDSSKTNDRLYFDVTYYEGNFYAVDYFGEIYVCEIEDPKAPAKTRVIVPRLPYEFKSPYIIEKLYLVESAGALLLVKCPIETIEYFKVFKVPTSDGNWSNSELKNLGNRSLFLGCNSSFSVEASNYGCKANCIYYTNRPLQRQQGEDMGIFNMEDGKVESYVKESLNFLTPHLWVEPSL
ncbi:F-box protein SKIP23-like [Pyrus ussuriensis x Pyrus communis]|uniref:F-box protein SKIP23-like n=1 Tax=Pyrus ussuriensis x Pyrus communis TaxID=2448454 RepID=A0A5N5ICT1_9ROSA|nr:F-box protein SKIP23-like [Pyrus ussuriensis x Pyrus communis]